VLCRLRAKLYSKGFFFSNILFALKEVYFLRCLSPIRMPIIPRTSAIKNH